MRLSCNLITSDPSRFWTAGEPIPDEMVPDHAKQYRISEQEGAKLYREILEWRAIVAAKREKKRASGVGKHGSARARL